MRELLDEDRARGDANDLRETQRDSENCCLEGGESVRLDNERVLDTQTALEIGDGCEEEEDPRLGVCQSFDEPISSACQEKEYKWDICTYWYRFHFFVSIPFWFAFCLLTMSVFSSFVKKRA
jgi:hypothetical protein